MSDPKAVTARPPAEPLAVIVELRAALIETCELLHATVEEVRSLSQEMRRLRAALPTDLPARLSALSGRIQELEDAAAE